MSAGQGSGRRGSYHSRLGGTNTPSGVRRPGRGGRGGSDNVLPLITGVLGSSILAFSLYVFSQKPGVFGAEVDEPTVLSQAEHTCYQGNPECSGAAPIYQESCYNSEEQSCPYHGTPPTVNIEKKKWLTPEEEAAMREKEQDREKQQNRGKLQRELKQHLRKVKELTEELERDEKAKRRSW